MRFILEIQPNRVERTAKLQIDLDELTAVYLSVAEASRRNRTGHYMRRHRLPGEDPGAITPDEPLRTELNTVKWCIADHVAALKHAGLINTAAPDSSGSYVTERLRYAVPISDLVANLLRPCCHRDAFGGYRLFHFDAEPIARRDYWCLCAFDAGRQTRPIDLRWVRFDARNDRILDTDDRDLLDQGLIWAAAVVPLVDNGKPLAAVEIARHDYDLRHLVGRHNAAMETAYEGWFDQWDTRVAELVAAHHAAGKPYEVFYHSMIAINDEGDVTIRQQEGTLPELAIQLVAEGAQSAGLLDSGGSCAIFDVWLGGYLNHGWYYREPRGSILVFELACEQRVPVRLPPCGPGKFVRETS